LFYAAVCRLEKIPAVVGVVTNNCFGGILLFYAAVCRLEKIPIVSAGTPSGRVDNVRHLCSIILVGDNTNKGGKSIEIIKE
jgi:hypothetical protein